MPTCAEGAFFCSDERRTRPNQQHILQLLPGDGQESKCTLAGQYQILLPFTQTNARSWHFVKKHDPFRSQSKYSIIILKPPANWMIWKNTLSKKIYLLFWCTLHECGWSFASLLVPYLVSRYNLLVLMTQKCLLVQTLSFNLKHNYLENLRIIFVHTPQIRDCKGEASH